MSTLKAPPDNFVSTVAGAEVAPGEIALWYIGGAGYLLKAGQATILLDPFLGPSNPPDWIRGIPPAFAPERIAELGPIDAVLLTHEHGDHADPVALGAIAAHTSAPVYGPASCIAVARAASVPADRCHVLAHDAAIVIRQLRVTAIKLRDGGAPEANGYVVETGQQTLLQAGDAIYSDDFVAAGKRWEIDAICLSVGSNPPGQSWYMDEVDAARAARDANARTLIPQHFDLWQGITLDPERVRIAAGWYCPETRVVPARFCQRITLSPDIQAGEAG